MPGFMSKECLAAIWQVTLHIGEIKGILGAEGTRQNVEAPENWLVKPVALPTDVGIQEDLDTISRWLAIAVPDIANECMEVFPEFPSVKQLTANGAVQDFQSPFEGETPQLESSGETITGDLMIRPGTPIPRPGGVTTDAYQLWNQLNEAEDAIINWIDEIFLEPSRHAMARVA